MFAGGSARPNKNPNTNDPIARLAKEIETLETSTAHAKTKFPNYARPGDLIANSGRNGERGSQDHGIYGSIVFPTRSDAAAQTVVYRSDGECLPEEKQGDRCFRQGVEIKKLQIGEWRDNFCESRSDYRVFACPAGYGHAGQDVWGDWKDSKDDIPLRSVVDGIAFRRFPVQPAVTISDVNGTNIDYIYRHMRPSQLSQHGIMPSEPKEVTRGCELAYVDRLMALSKDDPDLFDGKYGYEATARHLHFEIRVPTKSGFQYVSPYWTVVHAHKVALSKSEASPVASGSCKS